MSGLVEIYEIFGKQCQDWSNNLLKSSRIIGLDMGLNTSG